MKQFIRIVSSGVLTGAIVLGVSATIMAGVCGEGTGEPPFLGYGVDSNLLMLIDNSGSMLDTAYVDEDTDGTGPDTETQCFDNNYVPVDLTSEPPVLYAGTFPVYTEDANTNAKTEIWYKWVEVQPLWEHKPYAVGDRVYENGVIYEALSVTGNASSGSNIYDDNEVEWNAVTRPVWKASTAYHIGSFVYSTDDGKLYRALNSGTSLATATIISEDTVVNWDVVPTWANGTTYATADTYYVVWEDVVYKAEIAAGSTTSGTKPWDDTGVVWEEFNPLEWQAKTSYAAGDIVTYQGMIFEAKSGYSNVAAALTIFEDNYGVNWLRLDTGYYEEVTEVDALAYCNSKTGTVYTSNGLCITHNTPAGKPERVTAYAASGNFLNWLTASKFDIQKSILTGGKYNKDVERLISENRGCSGSRFIKQVTLNTGDFLTLSVRGPRKKGAPQKKDRVDFADDTTRIEILAISATGYDASSCQEAIDRILTQGLNGSQQQIDACLAGTGTTADARTALNHAMQYCWQTNHTRNLNTIVMDCEKVYTGLNPGDIENYSNAYNCYGTFDANFVHDTERVGYAGRCYDIGSGATGSKCEPYKRNVGDCDWNNNDPCTYQPGGSGSELFRNRSDFAYSEICTQLHNNGSQCQNNNKWDTRYTVTLVDPADAGTISLGDTCNPTDAMFTSGATAEWSSDIDGTPSSPAPDANDTALVPGTLPFNNNTGLTDEAAYCFYEGMEDYCSDLLVPEVIDPTDQETSTSGDYGNIPALLVDSGVLNKLGVDVPMNVMSGHVKSTTQPQGILHRTARELRIGAMAFNSVGAFTECQAANTTNLIEEYCPATNRDGAQIISPIRLGSRASGSQTHVDDLAEAVNGVRATSWTPLAEAVYNAIGYYTQNTDIRINNGDFQTDSDVIAGWQGGRYYASGSYILAGASLYQSITGGVANGDATDLTGAISGNRSDTGVIWIEIGEYKGDWSDSTSYNANDIVKYNGKFHLTVLGGTSALKAEAAAMGKNGPLYDAGVNWEFLVDPVINHCQENFILIISEGASTADVNSAVENFVLGNGSHPFNSTPIIDTGEGAVDADVANQCSDGLKGSTYVDDLTFFAQDENDLFDVYPATNSTLPDSDYPFTDIDKNNITTYIVTAGKPRNNGNSDECNPSYIMDKAAGNGGTGQALQGENPYELEQRLQEVFNELRQRASAGSAASVISSARGGEGAIYQAIFWPELVRGSTKVSWAGDVHGLFLSDQGYMYEDTNGDRTLNPSEDLDKDGKLDCGEDTNCNGVRDGGEPDLDSDLVLDESEDLNQNGVFDAGEDIDGDGHFDLYKEDADLDGVLDTGDQRVIIFFDDTPGVMRSRVCWNNSINDTLGGTCTNSGELEEVHFLWSANKWLSEYPVVPAAPSDLTVRTNRWKTGDDLANYTAAGTRQRQIFTWNDDGDGIVQDAEVVAFQATADQGPDWTTMAADFSVSDNDEVDQVIRWIRGEDFPGEDLNDNGLIDLNVDLDGDGSVDLATEDVNGNGRLETAMRSRQSQLSDPDNLANTYGITWRLGDIIHSTPMTVASPVEGFHLIYNDFSYAEFVERWARRRHMVYFGANDGMLHAVNAGFFNTSAKKFYLGYDFVNQTYNDTGPDLGTEMWAYVPYNLRPHLKCLTDINYSHKYYVDLRPRIFDVQIFQEEQACIQRGSLDPECYHPNGWGTILVGGMRFGGSPTTVGTTPYISAYFILDITNPEAPPELLGEITQELDGSGNPKFTDLGFSTVNPGMVVLKDRDEVTGAVLDNDWYLILGSGPNGPVDSNDPDFSMNNPLQGKSTQKAKVSVLPLAWLGKDGVNSKTALRLPPDDTQSVDGLARTITLTGAENGFVSDLIVVDYDINPSYEEYKSDAVYFGTVEGEVDSGNNGFSTYSDGETYWNGGGHMYRLVMEPTGHIVGKTGGAAVTVPGDWALKPLLNLGSDVDAGGNIVPEISGHPIQPITTAASIGTDGYNFWIYFGTGRFWDVQDKTDRQQQSYYGIKEPMELVTDPVDNVSRRRKLTWESVELSGTSTNDPGGKGLVKVDEILVGESVTIDRAPLTCRDNTDLANAGPVGNLDCMTTTGGTPTPTGMPAGGMDFYSAADNNAYFDKLERFIAGSGFCFANNCTELATCSGSDYGDSDYKDNCTDGWRKDFWPYENREKNIGQATLLGGLVTFTTYQPNSGQCQAEGSAYLYAVYYKTGTAWFENVFGNVGITASGDVKNKLSLGRGVATTPNLHVGSGGGDGPRAFIQTSTGEIKEIQQENLPISGDRSKRSKWKEYMP